MPLWVRPESTSNTNAVCVALALAPLAVETNDEHAFVTQFLGAVGRHKRHRLSGASAPPAEMSG